MNPRQSTWWWALAVGLTGCAALQPATLDDYYTEPYLRERWLPALHDGGSTRAQIEARLGPPSRRFEDGRLVTYRLILTECPGDMSDAFYRRSRLVLTAGAPPPRWVADRQLRNVNHAGGLLVIRDDNRDERAKHIIAAAAEYHLVLVYDGAGTLTHHALLRRRP